MRRVILNTHLFIAILAGMFMVIQGVTGSIMEFEPELDRAFHADLSYITPDGQALPASQIISAVRQQLNDEPVVAYLPSLSPELSSEVLLPSGIAFVNQYTGKILGRRNRGQTFLGYVRALHVRLGTGDAGKTILRWSAVAMLLSAGSGLYLWWPVKRISIRTKDGLKRFWFDLHNVIGICSLLPLALLATTGAIIGFESQLAPLVYKLTHSLPMHTALSQRKTHTETNIIDVDTAVATACTHMPGAMPSRVQMPQYGGLYRVEMFYPHDRTTGSRNVVAIDPFDGSVVSLNRSADLSRGDWILAVNEAIHTGAILGLPGRIIASLASLIVFVQASSGAFIWLYRKRILAPPIRVAEGVRE